MLALDRPYIANSLESAVEASDEICLEYGSATQLYLVPFVQHEEQVSHASWCICLENDCQEIELICVLLRYV